MDEAKSNQALPRPIGYFDFRSQDLSGNFLGKPRESDRYEPNRDSRQRFEIPARK
jgi:hypothetical protein